MADGEKKSTETTEEKTRRLGAGEWIPAFLQTLGMTANVRLSCKQAGISRRLAYKWRDEDETFRAQWDEAMEDALDILEGEGMKRARATSDTLLIFFLKSHRREIYGEQKQVKVGGLDGGPLKVLHDVIEIMDDEEDGEGKK